MMKRILNELGLGLALLAATAAASAPAHAAGLFDPTAMIFARADANHDGKLDAAEMEAMRRARFARLDLNHDGAISESELAHAQRRLENAHELAQALVENGFDRLDTDGDGLVSQAEFLAKGPGPMLALLDTDGDGAISRAEMERVVDALAER